MNTTKLTLFSFGGGQDSWAILLMFIFNREFRKRYAPGKLLVIMSDTGWEHPRTYLFLSKARNLCLKHNIEFYVIERWMGYHGRTWQTLTHNWEKNNTIGSVTFSQTCTDNIKIKPQYKFVSDWLAETYNIEATSTPKRFYEVVKECGKIDWIIGFAHGENREKDRSKEAKYRQECVNFVFPLKDLRFDRQSAQDIIQGYGFEVPPPSNCTICFWMSEHELVWLYRNIPKDFWHWVKLERNKLNRFRAQGLEEEKNKGVFGNLTVVQKLKKALEKYGHWTTEQLEEYKMSHGHCTKSKF